MYFITLAHIEVKTKPYDIYELTEDIVSIWSIGYTKTKKEAIELAKENLDNLLINISGDYNTAIIEDIPEGVFNIERESVVLFKNSDGNFINLSKKQISVESQDEVRDSMEFYQYMF